MINSTLNFIRVQNNVDWDDFINSALNSSYQQTSAWAQLYSGLGWEPYRLALKDKNEILIGSQIFVYKVKFFGKIALMPQGACYNKIDRKLAMLFIDELKSWIKDKGLTYFIWDVNYRSEGFTEFLKEKGFEHKINGLPPTAVVSATTIINLTLSEEEIYSKLSKNRKRNLKKSEKFNVSFEVGGRKDIGLFYRLLKYTCERRKVEPLFNGEEFYYKLWDGFKRINGVKLFFASVDGKKICAMLCLAVGDTFSFLHWGWSGEFKESNVSHALYWHTIKWAKKNGYLLYDFVQVDSKIAEAYLNGVKINQKLMNRPFSGPTINKMKWGGDLVIYPDKYMYVPNSVFRFLLKSVISHVLNSRLFYKIRDKFYRKL